MSKLHFDGVLLRAIKEDTLMNKSFCLGTII